MRGFNAWVIGACLIGTGSALAADVVYHGQTDTTVSIQSKAGAWVSLDVQDTLGGIGINTKGAYQGLNVEAADVGAIITTADYGTHPYVHEALIAMSSINSTTNYGAELDAAGSNSYNIGALAYAYGSSYSTNVGLEAGAFNGISNTAAIFDGDVTVTGSCDCYPSDAKFKKNVRPLDYGLEKIMSLRPKAYDMKTDEYKDQLNLAKGPQVGLIAQEVKEVMPELVRHVKIPARLTPAERKSGVKKPDVEYESMNYVALVPVLVKAMQDQQAEIESLKSEVASLKAGK